MNRYELKQISPQYYASIASFREELFDALSSFDGCSSLERYDDIEKWHLNCVLFENADTVPPGYSLGFQYLFVDENDEVVGMINIRPLADSHPMLKQYGGHIGYCVRPSCRRQGIGAKMLGQAKEICKERFGLNRIMITCLQTNEASRRTILHNDGILDSVIYYAPEDSYLERYYIEL